MRLNRWFFGIVALLGVFFVSCSKEYSVDPDPVAIDSSAVAQVALKAGADSIIMTTQVGILSNNASSSSNYIKLPIVVSKAGVYNVQAVAYFGKDSLILQGKGYVTTADSIFKLYPVNLGDFSTGTYITDSIMGNRIYVNGNATGYRLNITIVVDQNMTDSTSPVSSMGDSAWTCLVNDKDTLAGNFDMVTAMPGMYILSSSIMTHGDYLLGLTFALPANMSQLPITIPGTSASTVAGINLTGLGGVFVGGFGYVGTSTVITITKYNASTKHIEGRFEGSVKGMSSEEVMTVKYGIFKMTLQ